MPDDPQPNRPALARRTPNTEALVSGYVAAADVILSLLNHIDELDTCDLPIVEGRSVRIVALSEVESWLQGCATRVRHGNVL